jgi:hypothetical protein
LKEYKLGRPNEYLMPPKQLEQENLTTKDLDKATTTEDYIDLIKKWAESVYKIRIANHLLVSQIAFGFINKYGYGKL